MNYLKFQILAIGLCAHFAHASSLDSAVNDVESFIAVSKKLEREINLCITARKRTSARDVDAYADVCRTAANSYVEEFLDSEAIALNGQILVLDNAMSLLSRGKLERGQELSDLANEVPYWSGKINALYDKKESVLGRCYGFAILGGRILQGCCQTFVKDGLVSAEQCE